MRAKNAFIKKYESFLSKEDNDYLTKFQHKSSKFKT